MTAEQPQWERRSYKAGETIFREGDPGREMFIVDSGRVRIWRGEPENQSVLGFIEPKGIFGEMALINSNPRIASATAETDVICSIVSKDEFLTRFNEVNNFVRALIKLLAMNVNSLSDFVEKYTKE